MGDARLGDQPPSLLPGPTARTEWLRWGAACLALPAAVLLWFAVTRGGAAALPWLVGMEVLLLAILVWRSIVAIRVINREHRAGYTTLGYQLDRYWLLDHRTGQVRSAPRRAGRTP